MSSYAWLEGFNGSDAKCDVISNAPTFRNNFRKLFIFFSVLFIFLLPEEIAGQTVFHSESHFPEFLDLGVFSKLCEKFRTGPMIL